MSTLFVSDTTDYSSMSLAGVTAVNFVNTFPASATATFDISQFDGVQIDFSVTFSGSTGFNGVTIKGSQVTLADFDFTNWSAIDRITAQGTTESDQLFGSILNDTLNGRLGNDELDAGTGFDRLSGGGGDDSITTDWDGNADIFNGGGGIDTLFFHSIGGAYDFSLDLRDGGGGRDIGNGSTVERMEVFKGTFYSDGAVQFWGGSREDEIGAGSSADVVNGMAGNDFLAGGGGADILSGGSGDDLIDGESGRDLMTGGKGADIFYYNKVSDSPGYRGRDTITDFTSFDLIDLSSIDADSTTNVPNQPGEDFTFIGNQAFHDEAGELRYVKTRAGNTLVQGDTNGDGTADLVIELTGWFTLTAAEFDL